RGLLRGEGPGEPAGDWPVHGAVIGYLAYEAGRTSAGLPEAKAGVAPFMPDAALGLYGWTIVVDHQERRAAITSMASVDEAEVARVRERVLAACEPAARAFGVTGPIASTLDREAYLPRARRVLDYIAAGDCYQAHL